MSFRINPAVKFLARILGPELLHSAWLELLEYLPLKFEPPESLEVETKMGRLRCPVGLAAGYDKSGKHVGALSKLGFGYIVAGSFTLKPRKGHPKPRIAYRDSEQAVVNAMGLPNPGVMEFMKNFKRVEGCRVVASITGDTIGEFVECFKIVQKVVDAVEVNISCPTHEASMSMKDPKNIRELAERLREVKSKPAYIKIPPPVTSDEMDDVCKLLNVWMDCGMDGVTAVNTLLVDAPELALGRGGLSGRPLRPIMLKTVSRIRKELGEGIEINAVGGIMTGTDALEALRAGANTVQIMTAMLFRGPNTLRRIIEELISVKAR
ncbi:MAG: dihydroorotate dehydrogenase 2 [Thaumarchaeota archaeon]|nr:dihydroorotate dehydrogenase 2 [Candidatus Terraquivivens yellowstonensis]MCL7397540.1 dihydroorotate dehydrogenase 2 [Candidatus Terraquivivens yellowstonensis]MCL7400348.1 dihydroorotate dehydrogenase 2 [Candidatus Terraquivivens yellowstonensis]